MLIQRSGSVNVSMFTATRNFLYDQLDKKTYEQNTEPMQSHINVGFGWDITIAELTEAIARTTGYQGIIKFDASKPDGPPRKWMSSELINKMGWRPQINLEVGLKISYKAYKEMLTELDPLVK